LWLCDSLTAAPASTVDGCAAETAAAAMVVAVVAVQQAMLPLPVAL